MDSKITQLKADIDDIWEEMSKKYSTATSKLEKKMKKMTKERDDYKEKYTITQEKINHIEDQLSNTMSQLDDLSREKGKELDMMKLLDVYLVLMNQVFGAASHVRLLVILHGEKEEYTMTELANAAGYPALQVKKTIFELRNSDIVDLDEDRAVVTLKQRFM